jgi:ribonuclease MRP protein subunit RMP1
LAVCKGTVEWMITVDGPKNVNILANTLCSAFSQLAADNQFATLGLVLMGVLAQVTFACVQLVGEQEIEESDPPPTVESTIVAKKEHQSSLSNVDDGVDLGQAVSREELAQSRICGPVDGPVTKRKKLEGGSSTITTTTTGDGLPKVKSKKKGPEIGALATSTAADKGEKPAQEERKKKTKKKGKGKKGEEFGDLFSVLY